MTASLTIVIDARWIFPRLSGIGRYTADLSRALLALDTPHRFRFLFDRPEQETHYRDAWGLNRHDRAETVLFPHGLFSPASQALLPGRLKQLGADVYHSTNYMMPLLSGGGAARVVTIHDLIPLLFRDHAPKSRKNRLFPVYQALMRRIGRSAEAVIAVSDATRTDIARHLGTPPDRLHVTPEGVDPRYTPSPDHPRRPQPPEVLYVGRRDPYKNLPLLIEAFADLVGRGIEARLRIIGPEDPRYPEARETASRHALGDRVQWDGYVDDPALLAAYRDASVFVLPSRYEGFGLPVLEAMACGTPVICSRASSLPDVGGRAAMYLDDLTAGELAHHLARLLTDDDAWSRCSRDGLAHAAGFTWSETARLTLAVYEHTARHR